LNFVLGRNEGVTDRANGDANHDLQRLLADLSPRLSARIYSFATTAKLDDIPAHASIVGTFMEDEGLTIVGALDEADFANVGHSGGWAKISLGVNSSLTAVGLTATISTALAEHGISANVIAAFFHDHIFVPWEKRHQAMKILEGLASNGA
jgi:hypothetical protein